MPEAQRIPDHVVSVHINVPRQKAWDEITKRGLVQRPLYNTVLDAELRPGGRLRYYSPDRKRVFIVGEVVEVDPPRKFSHTYMFTTRVEPMTLVTWDLVEEANGTRVTITHSGYTTAHKAPEKVAAGWTEILGLLKQELETGDIPAKTKILYKVMNWFLFLMPASTKASHWEK